MSRSRDPYRLSVRAPLSEAAAELISHRFGAAAGITVRESDVVVELAADQAALRAMLTLLWDSGHEVLAVSGATPPA